jgi:hypothetical protein
MDGAGKRQEEIEVPCSAKKQDCVQETQGWGYVNSTHNSSFERTLNGQNRTKVNNKVLHTKLFVFIFMVYCIK